MSVRHSLNRIASLETLYLAWERVRENHGCAGIDGVTIEMFVEDVDIKLRRLAYE